MKAYTDLEQSKKLAEFLPLGSADMYYFLDPTPAGNIYHLVVQQIDFEVKTREPEYDKGDIPCWSLAALLEIIPSEIFSNEYIINITEGLDNRWLITYDNIYNKRHSFYGLSSSADNLIDACYEIILKLHERKLL